MPSVPESDPSISHLQGTGLLSSAPRSIRLQLTETTVPCASPGATAKAAERFTCDFPSEIALGREACFLKIVCKLSGLAHSDGLRMPFLFDTLCVLQLILNW